MRWGIWSWKEGGEPGYLYSAFKIDFNENGLTLPRNIDLEK
jgi:hypothetical protein